MKKMKKLFFSVFALSALMLSACSGGEQQPSSSAAGESSSTSQKQSSSEESSAGGDTSSGEETSSAEEESSSAEGSSSEVDPSTLADYRVKIGTQTYDLVLDEGQHGYQAQYYFGDNVTKTVAQADAIVFEKLANDTYSPFAVEPSPNDETGWTYNNVTINGDDYYIKESGNVQLYLKQDSTSHEWSFWITGGGAIPKPDEGWYLRGSNISVDWGIDPNYTLEEGTGDDAGKFFINYDAIQGDEFKICHIDAQGNDFWYPYNKGSDENPEYVGYYKNSETAQSAIYKGYLYGAADYNLKTIVPGNYRIEIDTNDNDFGIWTSINENTDHSPKRTDLMVGLVGHEEYEAAAPFGTLAAGGYKYFITVPLGSLTLTDKIYIRWKDNTELIVEPDDEDNPTIAQYFIQNDDLSLSLKELSSKTVEITFALQCGEMIVSAAETAVVSFRVQAAASGLTQLYVVGDFNNWTPSNDYKLTEIDSVNHIYQTMNQYLTLSKGQHAFKFYNGAEEGDARYEYAGDNRTIDVSGSLVTPIYIYGNPDGHVGEYYLFIKKGESSWESTSLSPKSENTEYYVENIALEAGQEFKINLDSDWRGFSQIKPSSPAKDNFEEAESDDNIKVLTAGSYDIYVKVTPDAEGTDAGKSIYIAEHSVPTPVVYYLEGTILGVDRWNITDETTASRTFKAGSVEGEYVLQAVAFQAGDEIKVFGDDTWYPGGEAPNYPVEAGVYNIYFRPAGNTEWAATYFYFEPFVAQPVALTFWQSGGSTYTLTPAEDNKSVQISYENVSGNSYYCIGTNTLAEVPGRSIATSFDVTLENKGTNPAKFRVDVKGTTNVPESGDTSNACINTKAVAPGHTDIYTDLTYGGSTITLAAGEKVTLTVYFDQSTAKGPLDQVAFFFDSCTYGDTAKYSSTVEISNFTFGLKVAPVELNIKVGGADIDPAKVTAIPAGDNLLAYKISLEKNDEISFEKGTTPIHFYTAEGDTSYVATADGDYYFYYNTSEIMFVSIPVTFKVQSTNAIEDGYSIYVVGDSFGWEPVAAYKLTNNEGTWTGTFGLPGGDQAYKFVKSESTDPTTKYWEPYEGNRTISDSDDRTTLFNTPVSTSFPAVINVAQHDYYSNEATPAGQNVVVVSWNSTQSIKRFVAAGKVELIQGATGCDILYTTAETPDAVKYPDEDNPNSTVIQKGVTISSDTQKLIVFKDSDSHYTVSSSTKAITFKVTMPDESTNPVYIAGDFTNWAQLALVQSTENLHEWSTSTAIELPYNAWVHFKFKHDGGDESWEGYSGNRYFEVSTAPATQSYTWVA